MSQAVLKICVVTGSRADWGHLIEVAKLLRDAPDFELQLMVTGAHLVPEYGFTIDTIIADGFTPSAKVDMLLAGDTPLTIAKSTGLAVIGMADAYAQLNTDLVLVLGDRYEILSAAQAAMLMGIPIAHLCGGDVTFGAVDDSIRHAVTKMAHVHFVTTQEAAKRVAAMGEEENRIHLVGSTAIDHILRLPRLERADFEASIDFKLRRRNLLVTFHPVTLASDGGVNQMQELLKALSTLPEDTGLIITKPNADACGRILSTMLDSFASCRDNVSLHQSLGQKRYLSALGFVDAVVGNSSSGLSEAPSFGIATVNVGDRQNGRVRATSVIDCQAESRQIAAAIAQALGTDFSDTANPYGDGHASERIVEALRRLPMKDTLLRKTFVDI